MHCVAARIPAQLQGEEGLVTSDEELALLIEEQRKDDTYYVEPQMIGRFKVISLEAMGEPRRHDLNPVVRRGMFRGGCLAAIPHGTYNGYHNYECRCIPCRNAHNA